MKINAKEAQSVKDEDKALQFDDKKTMAKSQEDNNVQASNSNKKHIAIMRVLDVNIFTKKGS